MDEPIPATDPTAAAVAKALADCECTPTELGRRLGVSRQAVRQWIDGVARPNFRAAVLIEHETRGKVSRYDIRPDIYGEKPRGWKYSAAGKVVTQ